MSDSIDKIARDVCEAVCEYRKRVGFDCLSMGCSGCRFEVGTMRKEITRRLDNITGAFFMPFPMGKDGELIKPGNTYYGEDGMAWAINAVGPVYCYGVDANKSGIAKRLRCEWLTKDAPDSWDSIERDCSLSPASYIAKRGLVGDYPAELMRIDLAARCNLLIGRCVK